MKNTLFLFLFLSSFLFSCKKKEDQKVVSNQGSVVVDNGKGGKDTIPFSCSGCAEHLSYALFNDAMYESTKSTKESLRNPLTFVPVSVHLIAEKDDNAYSFDTGEKMDSVFRISALYKYVAQNNFGVEKEGEHFCSFTYVKGEQSFFSKENGKDGLPELLMYEEVIRLDSLVIDSLGHVNRSLLVTRQTPDGEEEFIEITPYKGLIVFSSLSCVDEGTSLTISLENGEDIRLSSWNRFNCKGTSYFDPFNKLQQEKLKANRIEFLYINSDGKSAGARVPKNKSDYFQQFLNL